MSEITRIAIQGQPYAHGTLSDITDRQFGYYGTDKKGPSAKVVANVTSVVRDSKHLQFVLYSDGTEVARFGIRQRIWIGPQVTETPAARNASKTSKHAGSLALCLCGCGTRTARTYKQGHDARHASQVARRIPAEGIEIVRELPTAALQHKARRIFENATR